MPRLRKVASVTLVLAAAAVGGTFVAYKGCGCSSAPPGWTSVSSAPVASDLMAGEWDGNWASDSKPMRGHLKAVIEKISDGNYRSSFDAETAFGSSDKSVCVFHVGRRVPTWAFEGKEDLGLFKGGTYVYAGTVDGNNFMCTYDSTFDKGVFRMHRVRPPAAASSPASRSGQ